MTRCTKFRLDPRRLLSVLPALGMVFLVCAGGEEPAVAPGNTVRIASGGVTPDTIEVLQGNAVTWINQDTAAHRIAAGTGPETAGLFQLGPVAPGDTVFFKFDSLGAFPYRIPDLGVGAPGVVVVKKDTLTDLEFPSRPVP